VTADEGEDADGAGPLAERLHDPARVLALSDGVFAIIITLLVLEVHVPELDQGQSLDQALGELRPSLVARAAPGVSLLIYAGLPVLYFLSITVLRGSRRRDQEYADFT
jgi:hypothetical protein